MAAFGIGAELDFVDGQEVDLTIEWHRLDSADKPARSRRHDFLFAGDQSNRSAALQRHDPVVVLTRQQSQWETNHAAGVTEHPINRQIRLAGVGGP